MKFKGKLASSLVALGLVITSSNFFVADASTKTTILTDSFGDKVTQTVTKDSSGNVLSIDVEKAGYSAAGKKGYWYAKSSIKRQYEWPNVTVSVKGTGSSKSYTNSSKKSFKAIDKIGVRTTLTSGGVVQGTKSSSQKNSATASATASKANSIPAGLKWKDTSSHTFQDSGKNSWYPTTGATSW